MKVAVSVRAITIAITTVASLFGYSMGEDACAHLRPSRCVAIPDVSVNDRGKLTNNYRYDDYTVCCPEKHCVPVVAHSNWFCYDQVAGRPMIDYQARIDSVWPSANDSSSSSSSSSSGEGASAEAGRPLEDIYAECVHDQLAAILPLTNCAGSSCAECLKMYKRWVCAESFPKCLSQPQELFNTFPFTDSRYDCCHQSNATENSSDGDGDGGGGGSVSSTAPAICYRGEIRDGISNWIKSCRRLCQDVASECSARLVFKCPNTDLDYWDFDDQPECNNLGYPVEEDSSPRSHVIASALVYITVFIAVLSALIL